jgi:hypothetical protein
MADIRDGLTEGPNQTPVNTPQPSFSEQLAEAARNTVPVEKTPEPRARDFALDTPEEIVRQITGDDKSTSRNVADGLTVETNEESSLQRAEREARESSVEANRQLGLPDDATHEDRDNALGIPEQRAARELATLRDNLLSDFEEKRYAVAEGEADVEELRQAALNLRHVAPEAYIQSIKEWNDEEKAGLEEEAALYGYDDDTYREEMNAPSEALEFAQELETEYVPLKNALEHQQGVEDFVQQLGSRYGNEATEVFNDLVGLQETIWNNPDMLTGETARYVREELLATPLHEQRGEQLKNSLDFLDGLVPVFAAQLHEEKRAGAIRRFQESIVRAPSTSVADGLETAQDRIEHALARANALAAPDPKPTPINTDKALAVPLGYDPEQKGKSWRESVNDSFKESSRDVASGLTVGGRKSSLDDAVAKGAGFKDAREKLAHEQREREMQSRGLIR